MSGLVRQLDVSREQGHALDINHEVTDEITRAREGRK